MLYAILIKITEIIIKDMRDTRETKVIDAGMCLIKGIALNQ